MTELTEAREKVTDADIRRPIHEKIMANKSTILALQISNACGKALHRVKEVDQKAIGAVIKTLAVEGSNKEFVKMLAELPAEIRDAWRLVMQYRSLTRLPTDLTSVEQIEEILNENNTERNRLKLAIDFFKALKAQAKDSTPEAAKGG